MAKIILVEDEINIASFIEEGFVSSVTRSLWCTMVMRDGNCFRMSLLIC